MKKARNIFSVVLFALCSCNMSDDVVKLSNNYVFYHEGMHDNVIYNENGGKIIPCNVTAYNYNNNFIIAQQTPTSTCVMGNDKINYPSKDSSFYWIIAHKDNAFLGPLTLSDYERARERLGIPKDLQLKVTEYQSLNN